MKKVLIITAGLVLLALPALACGKSGTVSPSGQGIACSEGWEVVQSGSTYHGAILAIADGGLSAVNTIEDASISSGFSTPGNDLAMYTADGWVTASWDGRSDHVCARWNPDHVIVTPGPSTGDAYILDGDGCPNGFTFVHDGGSYGGCTFEPGRTLLKVYCNGEFNRDITRYESGPVWRSDSEPSEHGLQVFWPGGAFACVKER
jgi:hypothetical protein